MFEQAFRNIDDVLRKEAGCTTELDDIEQTSWLLFLKYLDGLEQDKATEAELDGKKYEYLLSKKYRWESWAAPKGKDGKLDHKKAKSGPDLVEFVNNELFPYLRGFKQKAASPNSIEYKIGEIFGEIKNRISSGYNLREIIDHIDELRFRSQRACPVFCVRDYWGSRSGNMIMNRLRASIQLCTGRVQRLEALLTAR